MEMRKERIDDPGSISITRPQAPLEIPERENLPMPYPDAIPERCIVNALEVLENDDPLREKEYAFSMWNLIGFMQLCHASKVAKDHPQRASMVSTIRGYLDVLKPLHDAHPMFVNDGSPEPNLFPEGPCIATACGATFLMLYDLLTELISGE